MADDIPQIDKSTAEQYKVTIPNKGTLTGYKIPSLTGSNLSTIRFTQVPYAKPGTKRFERPAPIPEDFNYSAGDYGSIGLKGPQPTFDTPPFTYLKSPSQENIQYLNIFIPDGEPPEGGWPVLIYIHGGWLQNGSPNSYILDGTGFNSNLNKDNFILISIGYRLNIFGFLSSKELLAEDSTSSNFGFWDQRLAIEWVYDNIKYFNGNPEKITVGGLSAGSYSTFFQLAYELYHPEARQIIKQTVQHSNMFFAQPKTVEESQGQYDEVVTKLGLKDLSATEQLEKLRGLDISYIEDFISTLDLHTFRAVTDDHFVSSTILKDIESGEFSKKLVKKNVKILIGEVDNEPWLYSVLNTPKTKEELKLQVENYYPAEIVEPLISKFPEFEQLQESDPDFLEKLRIVFGNILGAGQVYASERAFLNKIVKGGFPTDSIIRYRISYRAEFLKETLPIELGVTHGQDLSIWFYYVSKYTKEELSIVESWIEPYMKFLNFESIEGTSWKKGVLSKLNYFNKSGQIEYIDDPVWERNLDIAEAVYKVQL